MPDSSKTEVAVVLDRSGSMLAIREDMIGGFRAFVDDQRRIPGACTLSLYQFDDRFDVAYESVPLDQVPPLELTPRGRTALLDGVGKALTLVGERHDKLDPGNRPVRVLVVVITDGCENASTEWEFSALRSAIRDAECRRNWRFLFLGASDDAFRDARNLGMRRSARFHASHEGVRSMYRSLVRETSTYRTSSPSGEERP